MRKGVNNIIIPIFSSFDILRILFTKMGVFTSYEMRKGVKRIANLNQNI
jgi:hypothetical protein